ncbi:MAG: ABC transporter permease [Candidatus Staskawiczbacteria bacterium]|nr:ABC transporter permease [Candidatus Staskawiczbacteria bacterium]
MNSKALQQSIRALSANPVRTVLTTLGIVIGIATVIMVLSAGAGFQSLINDQIKSLGSDTLFIKTKVPPTTKNRAAGSSLTPGIAVGITTFKQRDLDDIKKLNNVVNDYGLVTGMAVASYRDNQKNSIYYGSSAEKFSIDQHTLKEGRFYTPAEDSGAAQVVILGSNIASKLFLQDDPLGKLMRIGNLNFQVIGIYNPQSGGIGGSGPDDILYMPLQTAQKKMLGIDYMTVGVVQLKDTNLADATSAQISLTLMRNHNITDPAKDDFMIMTQAQTLDTFNTIFSGITILLICIASISLVVGGVGIMNIMYVVVTERTAEIGLKKALGATNSDVLKEFLIESVLVTVLGGIIGILLGALLSWFVSLAAGYAGLTWTFVVPIYAIVIAVAVSAAIGISFGVLPARSAAKLDPIEALRYE